MAAALEYAVPAGDFIAEWMEDEGVNAAELARRLGVTPKHVSEVLSAKAPLSHRMALALERVTGISARLWNLYESGYRSAIARAANDVDLAEQYEQAKRFPLAYLRECGYVTASQHDHAGTVRELLEILGVASLDAFWDTWSHGSVAYRRSAVGRDDAPALAVWLALAERHHDGLADVPDFDRPALESLLSSLRALTRGAPGPAVEHAVERLRDVGVVLCFIPPVPGLGIHGATRWIYGNPVIQLSVLWKSDDQLWFTLFHELAHVLLHSNRELYVNGSHNEEEEQANQFASDLLIPPQYTSRLPRTRDIGAIRALAEELGVAPSIVLGRAQRLTKDYAWGHGLKHKFEFVVKTDDV